MSCELVVKRLWRWSLNSEFLLLWDSLNNQCCSFLTRIAIESRFWSTPFIFIHPLYGIIQDSSFVINDRNGTITTSNIVNYKVIASLQDVLNDTSPPHNPTSTIIIALHNSSFSCLSALTVLMGMGGTNFNGMHMSVVIQPAIVAWVDVWYPPQSHTSSLIWQCALTSHIDKAMWSPKYDSIQFFQKLFVLQNSHGGMGKADVTSGWNGYGTVLWSHMMLREGIVVRSGNYVRCEADSPRVGLLL